jgi:multidrug efflux pump
MISVFGVPDDHVRPHAAELAPAEDQGVLFGIGTTAANATLDQNLPYAVGGREGRSSRTRTRTSSSRSRDRARRSRALSPSPGASASGPSSAILANLQPKVSQIPGIQLQLVQPPALPGGGNFPIEVVLTSTADPQEILSFAKQLADKAMETQEVLLSRRSST